jgi:hypothetical protein
VPAPAPPPVGLPATAAIVAHWSASTIPPQADDTALVGWTDAIGGITAVQAVPAAQPRYRTGGAGGRPYVLFAGNQLLDAGSDNAVAAACRSGANSVLLVCRNVAPTAYGFLFTATPSTGYNLFHNGSQAGMFGQGMQRAAFAETGLTTLCYAGSDPDPSQGRAYINATCLNAQGNVRSAAGDRVAIGGSPALGFVGAKAEVYEVIAWNRPLTPAEVVQAECLVRDRHAAPYPWAGGGIPRVPRRQHHQRRRQHGRAPRLSGAGGGAERLADGELDQPRRWRAEHGGHARGGDRGDRPDGRAAGGDAAPPCRVGMVQPARRGRSGGRNGRLLPGATRGGGRAAGAGDGHRRGR